VGTETTDDDIARTFLAAFAEALGRPHANTWLKDASFDRVDGEWILFVTTRFNAHWIATRLDQELQRAAAVAGLSDTPAVHPRAACSTAHQ
jgi:chromosomal replication initiation ATPase DnaA